MYHFFEALLNPRGGGALIGYFARVIDTATQEVVPIYADANSTAISTVSGVANMAKTDDDGNLSFYVEPDTYHLDIYSTDAVTFIRRVQNVAMASTQGEQGEQGPKGDPGGALSVGLFSEIGELNIPTGTDMILTSGWSAIGTGAALYRVGASTDPAATESRTSTNTANGRPVYLAEYLPSVHMAGALGGGEDATAAFEALQDAFDAFVVPPGEYGLDEFAILSNKQIRLDGAVIVPVSTSRAAITATNADNWALTGRCTIRGPYEPETHATTAAMYVEIGSRPASGTGIGIKIQVCRNWLIENLTIVGINGTGVKFTGGLNYYPRTYGKLINPNISWCSVGIETVADDTAAEYLTIDNPVLAQNKTGIIVAIGNIEVNGGQIVDNEIGVDLVGEVSEGVPANNHAHGMFTGVQINHNYGRNVNANSILNGHTFVSCHFYGDPPSTGYPLGQGLIVLNNCKGVNFVGGIMASPIYPFASDPLLLARNTIRDMWIPDPSVVGPFYEGTTDGDAARAQMMFIGNRTATGSWSGNQPMEVAVNASRTSSNQSVTASTLTDVIFNNVVQDRQSLASAGDDPSYDNTTGVFTAPSTGWYDIESLVRVVSDTGTFTGGDVFIKVVSSGTTYTIVNPLVKVSTTEARTRTAARLFLAATAEVNLTVSVAATNPAVETGSTLQITMRA